MIYTNRTITHFLRGAGGLLLAVSFSFLLTHAYAQGKESPGIDMNAFRAGESFHWGVRSFHAGSLNQAIMYFEKALGYKPENATERIWLGRAFYKSGFEEAALGEWNSLLRRGKGTRLLENTVGVVTARRGLAKDLFDETRFVVSGIIDAAKPGYHAFKRPTSVRARKDGSVYIVAFGTNEVLLVDPNGAVREFYRGGIEGFDHPFDVLPVDDGTFFVSEYSGNRITKCDRRGGKIKSFGTRGTKDDELLGPQFLATDNNGYIYVTDYGNRRVSKFDVDGAYVLSFGRKSPGFEGLSGPTGIAVIDNNVYVADVVKKRIAVFDPSGNFLESFGTEFLKGPEGIIHVLPNTLLVTDAEPFTEKTRICRFDLETETWSEFSSVGSQAKKLVQVSADPNGDVYACDVNLNKVFIISGVSDLYSGMFVQVERIDAKGFPNVIVDVSCQDRYGRPVIGLKQENFLINENSRPVMDFSMFEPVASVGKLEIVLLVEKSEKIRPFEKEIAAVARRIIDLAGKSAHISVVTASENPVIEAEADVAKIRKIDTIFKGEYSPAWKFAPASRLATASLLPVRTRRAIVFITEGSLEEGQHFADYSLIETVQYMKNNFVGFFVVSLGQDRVSEALEYMTSETQGSAFIYSGAAGIERIMDVLLSRDDPRYVIKYESVAETGFGKEFIGVDAEVSFRARSGRDESGFFAPIE